MLPLQWRFAGPIAAIAPPSSYKMPPLKRQLLGTAESARGKRQTTIRDEDPPSADSGVEKRHLPRNSTGASDNPNATTTTTDERYAEAVCSLYLSSELAADIGYVPVQAPTAAAELGGLDETHTRPEPQQTVVEGFFLPSSSSSADELRRVKPLCLKQRPGTAFDDTPTGQRVLLGEPVAGVTASQASDAIPKRAASEAESISEDMELTQQQHIGRTPYPPPPPPADNHEVSPASLDSSLGVPWVIRWAGRRRNRTPNRTASHLVAAVSETPAGAETLASEGSEAQRTRRGLLDEDEPSAAGERAEAAASREAIPEPPTSEGASGHREFPSTGRARETEGGPEYRGVPPHEGPHEDSPDESEESGPPPLSAGAPSATTEVVDIEDDEEVIWVDGSGLGSSSTTARLDGLSQDEEGLSVLEEGDDDLEVVSTLLPPVGSILPYFVGPSSGLQGDWNAILYGQPMFGWGSHASPTTSLTPEVVSPGSTPQICIKCARDVNASSREHPRDVEQLLRLLVCPICYRSYRRSRHMQNVQAKLTSKKRETLLSQLSAAEKTVKAIEEELEFFNAGEGTTLPQRKATTPTDRNDDTGAASSRPELSSSYEAGRIALSSKGIQIDSKEAANQEEEKEQSDDEYETVAWRVGKCGHMYCKSCITTHLRQKQACPLCNQHLTARQLFPLFL